MIEDRLKQSENVVEHLQKAIALKVPDIRHRLLIDFYLLRAPDSLDEPPNPNGCFIQNITVGTVIGNYKPGGVQDPGLGGRTCCPSDYVVARQKKRPVTP